MRTLLSLLVIFSSFAVHAQELTTFDDIHKSLESGRNIRLIINFDHCAPTPPVANIRISTSPVAVMIKDHYLQFANSPLTTNNPLFSGIPVLENCTYKILDTNQIKIISRVITLPDYKVVHEMTSVCELGSGVNVFVN